MIAVLAECNCSTSHMTSDMINSAHYKDLTTLIVNGDASYSIAMGDPSEPTFEVFDIQQLTDSVSLVCSANADFCGQKELVLLDSANNEVDMSTS